MNINSGITLTSGVFLKGNNASVPIMYQVVGTTNRSW